MRTETITRNIYSFDELDDTARETARECYQHEQWWDYVFDSTRDAADMLGIDIDRDGIMFSGFSSQGDGACITGSYSYEPGSVARVRAEWPNDTALHDIAADLVRIQRPWFYGLSANITRHDRYSHEYSVHVDVNSDDDITGYRDLEDAEETLAEALRDFMRWIYKRLEAEYDWLMSDENIRCNEYEFYSDGSRA